MPEIHQIFARHCFAYACCKPQIFGGWWSFSQICQGLLKRLMQISAGKAGSLWKGQLRGGGGWWPKVRLCWRMVQFPLVWVDMDSATVSSSLRFALERL